MMTLLFFLVAGLVGAAVKRSADRSLSYRHQLALPAPSDMGVDPLVPAVLVLSFSAVQRGMTGATRATVFFELNEPKSTCSEETLALIKVELEALGGAAMLHWASYGPHFDQAKELIRLFSGITSNLFPISRVVVSGIDNLPPDKISDESKPKHLTGSQKALNDLNAAQFTLAELREAIITSQKEYPELWDDEDAREVLDRRIDDIRRQILRGGR